MGPASGYLTFWMESQGAHVTSFEVGYDALPLMVPGPDWDAVTAAQTSLKEHVSRTTNAWWYLHADKRSTARIVHGDIYRLPEDLGQYSLTTFACILLHLRDPFGALSEAAAHTSDTIVVVDQIDLGLDSDDPLLRFAPHLDGAAPNVTWWHFSPNAVSTMLWRLGFQRTRLVRHAQSFRMPDGSHAEVPLFSLVAERRSPDQLSSVPEWYDRYRSYRQRFLT